MLYPSTAASPRLVLASASPRRHQLLAELGVAFDAVATDIDESPGPGERPAELAVRLAEGKARAAGAAAEAVVIGSDTVVAVGDQSLGKPDEAAEAAQMLRQLLAAGTHQVLTGVAVCHQGRCVSAVATAEVTFGPRSARYVEWYLGTDEWQGKAGAYAMQGQGALLVDRIAGHPQTVIGLPTPILDELLGQFGYSLLDFVASAQPMAAAFGGTDFGGTER